MKRILMIAVAALSLIGGRFSNAAAPSDLKPGAPEKASHQVLVASERSEFKDQLVDALLLRLRERKVAVKQIDLVDLADIKAADWSAVVMVHTWENNLPPAAVSDFLARTGDAARIIDVITSGSGMETLPGVDVITSASVVDDIPAQVAAIDARIAELLNMPNTQT